jgi:phosphoglucomutase
MTTEKSIREKYSLWTKNTYFDEETRKELLNFPEDSKEIEDRFYCDLEFGTGGMRGVLGAGTNRMNKYVIRKITQGLADTILEHGEAECSRGVVIAYDSRRFPLNLPRKLLLCLRQIILGFIFLILCGQLRSYLLLSDTSRQLPA